MIGPLPHKYDIDNHISPFIPVHYVILGTRPSVIIYENYRLTLQTNTSLFNIFLPHSCAPRKTFQNVTNSKIALRQTCLNSLANRLKKIHLIDMSILSIFFNAKSKISHQ